MSILIDSYSESNGTSTYSLHGTSGQRGQSFTGNGNKITSAKFYISKNGTLTNSVVARVFAHTGTYGTSSLPTGSALAISDSITASTLSTSLTLVTFTFSGSNQIVLNNGVNYCIELYYPYDAGTSDYIGMRADTTSPTHGGNAYFSTTTAWSTVDYCFYIYGEATTAVSRLLTLTGVGT